MSGLLYISKTVGFFAGSLQLIVKVLTNYYLRITPIIFSIRRLPQQSTALI